MLKDGLDAIRSFHLLFRRKLLPGEQEPDEVRTGNRFDLLTQTIQRITMDTGQETSRTPFCFRCARRELTSNNKTLALKLQQSCLDFEFVETRRRYKLLHRDRA